MLILVSSPCYWGSGQLGHDVVRRLEELGIEAIGVDKEDFDLTDEAQTKEALEESNPMW